MKTPILSDYLLQHFDKQAPGPSNQQLYRLLRKAILDRVLQVDARLPSSRDLARELSTCRNTVLYAYDQLRAEGYIEGRSGSGTFVTDTAPQEGALNQTPQSHALWGGQAAPILSQRGHELVARAGAASQQWGAFVPGVPDVTQFPHQTWSRIHKKVWRRPSPDSLTYAQGGGYLPLREALADYLKVARCIDCSPEQVVITTGIHQSIDLCVRLLSDPGDLAWVEDPCYWGTRNLLRASGLHTRPVPVDAEGMCPDADDFAAVPRFIFLTPSHQYPLGMVMSLARRRLLLEYATRNDCWIIEDDYDSEFRYTGRPLTPLQGLDNAHRVLYMGTFSKTLYPGLRVGYLVLPPELVRPFVTGVNELHRAGTTQTQATLAEFINQGFFTSHIRRMRTSYARRLGMLQQLISNRFDPAVVQTIGSDAGLHLVLKLPAHCNDKELAAQATQAGVAVRPLSLYYHDAKKSSPGLLLGYACVHESQIAPAFEVLAQLIELHIKDSTTMPPVSSRHDHYPETKPSARLYQMNGFTLLELLVVIVIIGLLAAYIGPKYFSQLGKSEVTVAKAQIVAFEKALDTFRLDVGRYPTSEEGLSGLLAKPASAPKWNGPYLKKDVPQDPWGNVYVYKSPGSKAEFEVISYGKDGQPGGSGENADITN